MLLDHIESEMGSAAPEVQWTMNCALAEIGINFSKHRKRAIAIGEMLGVYRDYPCSKGCTSPFAPIWINAMVSRQGWVTTANHGALGIALVAWPILVGIPAFIAGMIVAVIAKRVWPRRNNC